MAMMGVLGKIPYPAAHNALLRRGEVRRRVCPPESPDSDHYGRHVDGYDLMFDEDERRAGPRLVLRS